jgi:hypothetical protein
MLLTVILNEKQIRLFTNNATSDILLPRSRSNLGVEMAKCPKCGRETVKPSKKWRYGHFTVEFFECVCRTKFKNYSIKGKYSFTLKLEKGKGYIKA